MKRTLIALLTLATVTGSVLADADLAKKKNCLACHAVDNKVVGPGYKDIAKKYAGQDATARLSGKIR